MRPTPRLLATCHAARGMLIWCAGLVMLLSWTACAHASCGDYLAHSGSITSDWSFFHGSIVPNSPEIPAEVPEPCDGPMCSRKDHPANGPAPRLVIPPPDVACLPGARELSKSESSRLAEPPARIASTGEYPPLFRPPRLLAD